MFTHIPCNGTLKSAASLETEGKNNLSHVDLLVCEIDVQKSFEAVSCICRSYENNGGKYIERSILLRFPAKYMRALSV